MSIPSGLGGVNTEEPLPAHILPTRGSPPRSQAGHHCGCTPVASNRLLPVETQTGVPRTGAESLRQPQRRPSPTFARQATGAAGTQGHLGTPRPTGVGSIFVGAARARNRRLVSAGMELSSLLVLQWVDQKYQTSSVVARPI